MIGISRRNSDHHDQDWGSSPPVGWTVRLSEQERERFAQHSRDCFRCQNRLAGYRAISGQVKSRLNRVPSPAPGRTIAAAAGRSHGWPVAGLHGRAAAAAFLVVAVAGGGAATPQVRGAAGGLVSYVGCVAGASCPASYAGDRAYFRAPAGSVIATSVQRFSLFTGGANGAGLAAAGSALLPAGPVYGLAGDRLLYRSEGGTWQTAARDGSDVRPFPLPADMAVVDITPAGDRLLVRKPLANGDGFDANPAQIQVLSEDGSVIWRGDANSRLVADITGISPDGSMLLGATTAQVERVPIAGGETLITPLTDRAPSLAQVSADGHRMAFVQRDSAAANAGRSVAYVDLSPQFQEPHSLPVPGSGRPIFRLSPDGRWLAVAGCDEGADSATCAAAGHTGLFLWNLDTREPDEITALHGATVQSLVWSADSSELLITAGTSGHVEAWLHSTAMPVSVATRVNIAGDVGGATMLPAGGLALLSDAGRSTGVVALDGGAALNAHPLSPDPSPAPRFAQAGGALALVSSGSIPRLVSRRGAEPPQLNVPVQSFSWAPDGRHATAVIDGKVYLWNDRSGLAAQPFAEGSAAAGLPGETGSP